MTARDLTGAGTSAATWRAADLPGRLPVLDLELLLADRVVLVAPHPDDEVLGCGATLAALAARGCTVHIVAVTDGEASHPGRREELRARRVEERAVALRRLGLAGAAVHRLGLPDSAVDTRVLRERLRPLISAGDTVLAPWAGDGHPDHDACGEAVAGLTGTVWSYLVWAWHWAGVDDVPWDRAVRNPLSRSASRAKREAVAAFESQLEGDDPILPRHVLDRLLGEQEVLLR